MPTQPFIILTPGDINGIGPEVTIKALERVSLKVPVILLAEPSVYQYYADICDTTFQHNRSISDVKEIDEPGIYFLNPVNGARHLTPMPGELDEQAGKHSMAAIEFATDICLKNPYAAMVTAPVSKEAVNKAGFDITGHTEYLARRDHTEDFVMMLSSSLLRVVPLSTHIPVSEVAGQVTRENIIHKLTVLNKSLIRDFGIDVPRIAVLGLNPHAGDGGVIGLEEQEIIQPALKEAYKSKIHCEGPFAADGFFAAKRYADYDAVLAMYHDQGLIPFKTLTFNGGVNFTAGLSFIRTSPDHGTAFGIAGMNRADYGSMLGAIEMAQYLIRRRSKHIT